MLTIPGFKSNRILYEGSHTLVYEGIREADNQKVIIKTLKSEYPSPELIAQFVREYQLLASLQGTGTAKVLSIETQSNNIAIVMKDEGFHPLKQLLGNPMPLSEFFKIAINIIEILEFLHSRHIIHKDLNPYNILIHDKTKQIIIIDFGISSVLLKEDLEMQNLQKLEGMLDYISPEQTGRMNRSIDYRTDFYSLGINFYEMLTGKVPFQEKDILELVHSHLAVTPDSVCKHNPSIPHIVGEIITKLLAKIPEDRYTSAAGIKEDLLTCQKRWLTDNKIEDFPLGQKDINDSLIISQKLYGRDAEVHKLLNIFESVSHGENILLLIAGYSGIGKTSLVKEIYKPITRQSGYIISGKFDQLQRATPYSAFFEAINELIRFLLTESEDKLRNLREKLLAALSNNGQVLIDVIPNIELVIGPQPAITELNPNQAQERFLLTMQNFIRALAQDDHPLVMFLDDLQWVDSASLQLMQRLMTDKDLHYFFLIGAYRNNEVELDHPLVYFEDQLKKSNIIYYSITLNSLTARDVHQLLADSLNMTRQQVAAFADTILTKTHGNPFYLYEFLRKLHQSNLLNYSYREYCWTWDLKKIQNEVVTDNVVDLLITRIYKLPEDAQRLLELASCIGHTFDLETLQVISQASLPQLAKNLFLATQSAFITPINKNYQLLELPQDDAIQKFASIIEYRFVHDRVQQASYQLIPEKIKKEVHLKIGRQLLSNVKDTPTDEQKFAILSHFDESLELITDIDEEISLADFYLWAGRKARISAAYQAAKKYLHNGLILIEQTDVNKNSDIYFELLKELATCRFLTGEFAEAENNYNELIKKAKATLSRIEVYKLHCQTLAFQNKHMEAIKLGLKALKTLDIHIPYHPNKINVLWNIIKIYRLSSQLNAQSNILPIMSAERFKLAADIMGQLLLSSIQSNEPLRALLSCKSLELSLKHGYYKNTTTSGLNYSVILFHYFNAKKRALNIVEYLVKMEDKYNLAFSKGRLLLVMTLFINSWRYPLEKNYEDCVKCYHTSVEEGDYFTTAVIVQFRLIYAQMVGKNVIELTKICDIATRFLEKNKMEGFSFVAESFNNLYEPVVDGSIDYKSKFLKRHSIMSQSHFTKAPGAYYIFYAIIIQLSIMLGDDEEAVKWSQEFNKYNSKAVEGTIAKLFASFYYGLAILTKKNLDTADKKVLKRTLTYLKNCVELQKENFQFYLLLFEAEIARKEKNIYKAMKLYHASLSNAESNNILPNIALACQRAGSFYLSMDLPELARNYYLKTHYAYQHWGAKGLCKHLEKKFPEWFRASTTTQSFSTTVTIDTSVSSLDVLSLLRATQVISSEIQLEALLKKLIVVLLQNAGAQRGALIMRHDNIWYVAVEGTTAAQQITLIADKDQSIENRRDVPLSIIRYVQRTQQIVQAQSAADFESFTDDPYIKEVKPQSVIVLPISYQGKMTTMLFLENRTTSHAFTPEHIHILKVLSSQAVISLENAKLYYQATHDPLTGLANRNLLYQVFEYAKGRANRNHTYMSILFLDLDGFKKINDTLGHEIGDKLLIHFAERLKFCIREGDLAVRLGGDEFIALLEDTNRLQITQVAERLLEKKVPIIIQGHDIQVGTSIGISLYPTHGQTIQELLKQADVALYRAKSLGKGNFQFYTNDLGQELKEENKLENDLANAAERGELIIFYQPVYSCNAHAITHFEALLRWQHPTLGLLEPEKFINLAESTGLILPIGDWVFKTVFSQLKSWKELGLNIIPIAINVSAIQLKKTSLSQTLSKLVNLYEINPRYIEIELTESIFIDIDDKISNDIINLKQLGIKLTLDDFGSHYSSLGYLRRFELDQIKIDQSFIKDLTQDAKSRELILSIINMAHNLNLSVVAEGVETKEQLEFLELNGIDALQGFYLEKPITAVNAMMLLTKR